jgi:hypothetical protein
MSLRRLPSVMIAQTCYCPLINLCAMSLNSVLATTGLTSGNAYVGKR